MAFKIWYKVGGTLYMVALRFKAKKPRSTIRKTPAKPLARAKLANSILLVVAQLPKQMLAEVSYPTIALYL